MPDEIRNCYGTHYDKLDSCPECEYRQYCEEAKDPPQLTYLQIFNSYPAPTTPDEEERQSDVRIQAVLRLVLELPIIELKMFRLKILNPDMSESDIARSCGCTRQHVSKKFRMISEEYPQMKRLLSPHTRQAPKDNIYAIINRLNKTLKKEA